MKGSQERCPGCGDIHLASLDLRKGRHRYIGASSGCWETFGLVLAREYGEFGYPEVHRLTVDTYAVQHPGVSSPKAIQSAAVHLIALYLSLVKKMPSKNVAAAMQKILAQKTKFNWLDPPSSMGTMTVKDVLVARDQQDHERIVSQWAMSVWEAWLAHHSTVENWCKERLAL